MDPACVGHLPSALRVERRLGELDRDAAVAELPAGADHGEDLELLVADEGHRQAGVVALKLVDLAGARVERPGFLGGTGALPLLVHEAPEPLLIDAHIALRCDLTGEVEGEAIGVVQLKRHLGRQVAGGTPCPAQRLLQDAHPLL